MRSGGTYTRDAALRKLARINRWLIAGSVALTAVLSDVAAQAFPGKTKAAAATAAKGSSARSHHHSGHSPSRSSTGPGGSLQPPAQAPRTAPEASIETVPTQESAPAQEAAPAEESAPAREPAPHAAEPASPSTHESAPGPESAPAPEPAPEPSAPVVSGGS